MAQLPDTNPTNTGIEPILIFSVDSMHFGAEIHQVITVVDAQALSSLPGQASCVSGGFWYMDDFIQVINVRRKFLLPEPQDARTGSFIVSRIDNELIAFWVDRVEGVTETAQANWQRLPRLNSGIFSRVLLGHDRMTLAIDLSKLKLADSLNIHDFVTKLSATRPADKLQDKLQKVFVNKEKSAVKNHILESSADTLPTTPAPQKDSELKKSPTVITLPDTTTLRTPASQPDTSIPQATVNASATKNSHITKKSTREKKTSTPSSSNAHKHKPENKSLNNINRHIIYEKDTQSEKCSTKPTASTQRLHHRHATSTPADTNKSRITNTPAKTPQINTVSISDEKSTDFNVAPLVFIFIILGGLITYTFWPTVFSNRSDVVLASKTKDQRISITTTNKIIETTTPVTTHVKTTTVTKHKTDKLRDEKSGNSQKDIAIKLPQHVIIIQRQNNIKQMPVNKPYNPLPTDILFQHTVVKGDTLWHIAKTYLYDPYRYPELARLSNIKNANLIYPGDIVKMKKNK